MGNSEYECINTRGRKLLTISSIDYADPDATENALGKMVYTPYNDQGQVTRTWGDTPYPLEYTYDAYGRMTQLKTFRDGANWEGPDWPADPGTPDTTTWTYDHATGLLAAKTYADGNGTTYTYDDAGRLTTRTWARLHAGNPLVTTYAYDPATGEQTSIDYSDATADITFTYNRMGQQATVTDATGTREFAYSATTFELESETLPSTFYGDKVITRNYDTLGREAGFEIGTAADPDTDYAVTYGYDTLGRFSSVSEHRAQGTP